LNSQACAEEPPADPAPLAARRQSCLLLLQNPSAPAPAGHAVKTLLPVRNGAAILNSTGAHLPNIRFKSTGYDMSAHVA